MVGWEVLPGVEERDGHGGGKQEEQPLEGAKDGAGLECAARSIVCRTSAGADVGRHGNPASKPRKDSHDLDADTNVAYHRALAKGASGNELEDDDQNGPRCAEEQKAPGVRHADGDVEVAGGGVDYGAVAVIHVDGYKMESESSVGNSAEEHEFRTIANCSYHNDGEHDLQRSQRKVQRSVFRREYGHGVQRSVIKFG